MIRNFLLILCLSFFNPIAKGQGFEYIDKPIDQDFIDSLVGVKSSPGAQYSAFEKDSSSFSIWIYSNWQESPISVCVLVEYTKDKLRIMKDILILDSSKLRDLFPNASLARGSDEQYVEKDGKKEQDNIVLSIYDHKEKDSNGDTPEYYTRILKAWTIDKTRLVFIELSTNGLTHYNEGWDG